ncbi:MAG TPA: T9SS type A sorting domain-containing protein, partial [Saprospiraceae bacterium]|nr:T9SS type A sorting domain-containing protein [Saprospiraceae bacterium]
LSSAQLKVEETNYWIFDNDQKVNISLNFDELTHITAGDDLFIIQLAKGARNSLIIELSNASYNQWYDVNKNINQLALSDGDKANKQPFSVFQNAPNPFNQYTEIAVFINELTAKDMQLNIYDLTGRKIHLESIRDEEGKNIFRINGDILPQRGLYQYEVVYGFERFVGRMVYVE